VAKLPSVSVIFCFAEEMWSTLLRSVWSVLDRTPPSLLVEIILVDDASTAEWLQEDFKKYVPLGYNVLRRALNGCNILRTLAPSLVTFHFHQLGPPTTHG
jgi:glycosyltransferase involved in cell wall biosynthesis